MFALKVLLEPSCCKKWQKKSQPRNWFGNRECLKVLNDTKLVLNVHEWPLQSFRNNLVTFRTLRPVSWRGLFFFCHFLQRDGSISMQSYISSTTNYGRPMKSFFRWNPEFLALGKHIGPINSGAFRVVSGQTLSTHFLKVPCPCFPLFNHYFYKKLSL